MSTLFFILFGYLLGSIPFGLVLTRFAGLGDIRAIGSGNIGATNVLRTGNKKLAAATLLLDGLKGTLAVLFARYFGHDAALLSGLAAFLGHLFPVWLGFKGGKGVATGLGVLLGASFPVGLLACLAWLLAAFTLRYSSLSALIAFAAAPLIALVFAQWHLALFALIISALVTWKHSANIARLRAGTEPKIGQKA
ncbi:MAG TPA: glycerol-3-phosphate 1-O-acyltransferase PlsY [Acidocella sp.]|nr:MAG: glycerol-3-phosphate acyltransferase [Acidocella sp. 20-61-6]HQT47036.1 glycerol-3-phosphate 1-O-acyltransferase PlsY [Acidocella sp.]